MPTTTIAQSRHAWISFNRLAREREIGHGIVHIPLFSVAYETPEKLDIFEHIYICFHAPAVCCLGLHFVTSIQNFVLFGSAV